MTAWLNANPDLKKRVLGSIFVFLATFIVYCLTVAPTVSFWDCGEFIACSYILGVAHPPGSPMFLLIGRIFSMIPFADQVALRTNMLSVLSAALASVVMFLILVKLLSRWKVSSWAIYVGAMTGALFMGYSNTFWANSVETEVYGLTIFLMLLMLYLVIIWMEHKQTPKGDRLLVLVTYLALLSVGVHMTSFLIVPILFLLVIWEDRDRLKDFRFWIAGIIFAMVMFSFDTEIILGSMLGWLILSILATVNSGKARKWFLAAAMMSVALVGVSNQSYIPIRSAQDPAIDENDPETFSKFTYFFERKQYGDQSMVKRAMTRRGQWINQIGDHERMGFWRFFNEQYMTPQLWFIPMGLGLFGLYQLIGRRRKEGVALLFLLLLCTFGLIWYMNFGDGTVPGERLEVRDRDYFFLPGFVFFAACLGLGAGALVTLTEQKLNQLGQSKLFKTPAYALGLIFILLPALALANNYHRNDRSGNWIPWDYAFNLLNSCEKDALMFTNGDNDTFPLWFLQEVEGLRKDVRIINLSLVNTDWYILQLKHQMNVPITLENNQIKWTEKITLPNGQKLDRPAEPYFDPVRNSTHYLLYFPDPNTGRTVRVQDLMIEHIIRANNWKYPIYFSATVSAGNRVGLDQYLLVQGYAYKLVSQPGAGQADTNYTEKVYKDENTVGLLINYPEKMIELAGYYQQAGDTAKMIDILEKARETYPDYWRLYAVLANIYDMQKMPDQKDRVTKLGKDRLKLMVEKAPGVAEYAQYLGLLYQFLGEHNFAVDYLRQAYGIFSSDPITYQSLLFSYMRLNRTAEMRLLAEEWLKRNPNDQNTLNLLRQLGAGQPLVQ
jgi:tetratricopeptide (TPR) repeat protein